MANLSAQIYSSCYNLTISFSPRFAATIERKRKNREPIGNLEFAKDYFTQRELCCASCCGFSLLVRLSGKQSYSIYKRSVLSCGNVPFNSCFAGS